MYVCERESKAKAHTHVNVHEMCMYVCACTRMCVRVHVLPHSTHVCPHWNHTRDDDIVCQRPYISPNCDDL